MNLFADMTNDTVSAEDSIRAIVRSHVESYASGFSDRHLKEVNDSSGVLNMKIHNVFVAALGPEVQYYSALARSLDSSLGNMLESMAINIGTLFYDITQKVEGGITKQQVNHISDILEAYTRNVRKPTVEDYHPLRTKPDKNDIINKRKATDYYLHDKQTGNHHLIELKIGGDLDNKKARSEKEAILEQYAILSNSLPGDAVITVHFATAYNRFGEGKDWNQTRVLQFFGKDELLIGADFWNFMCKRPNGYEIVIDEYRKNADKIKDALGRIKNAYLK